MRIGGVNSITKGTSPDLLSAAAELDISEPPKFDAGRWFSCTGRFTELTPSTDSETLPKDMYADWHYSLCNRFAEQVNPAQECIFSGTRTSLVSPLHSTCFAGATLLLLLLLQCKAGTPKSPFPPHGDITVLLHGKVWFRLLQFEKIQRR